MSLPLLHAFSLVSILVPKNYTYVLVLNLRQNGGYVTMVLRTSILQILKWWQCPGNPWKYLLNKLSFNLIKFKFINKPVKKSFEKCFSPSFELFHSKQGKTIQDYSSSEWWSQNVLLGTRLHHQSLINGIIVVKMLLLYASAIHSSVCSFPISCIFL